MKYNSLFKSLSNIKQQNPNNVFYAFIDGKQAGPMNESELRSLVKKGTISENTLIWMPQLEQWTQAQFIPIVNKLLLLAQKPVRIQSSLSTREQIHPIRADLIKGIVGLGYQKNEVATTVDKVLREQPNVTLENGIKMALMMLN